MTEQFRWQHYFNLESKDPAWRAQVSHILDKMATKPEFQAAMLEAHRLAHTRTKDDLDLIHHLSDQLHQHPTDTDLQMRMHLLHYLKPYMGDRGEWLTLLEKDKINQLPHADRETFRITISDKAKHTSMLEDTGSASHFDNRIVIAADDSQYKGVDGKYHTFSFERTLSHEIGHFLQKQNKDSLTQIYSNLPSAAQCIGTNYNMLENVTLDQSTFEESLKAIQDRFRAQACVTTTALPGNIRQRVIQNEEEPNVTTENRLMYALNPNDTPRLNYQDTRTPPKRGR